MPANPPSPDSHHLALYQERIDVAEGRLRRLCAEQPELARVRATLIGLEKSVHITEGWDAAPRLFILCRHEFSGRISHVPAENLTQAIHDWIAHGGISYPKALDLLSVAMERVRHEIDPNSADPGPLEHIGHSPRLTAFLDAMRSVPHADLFRHGPGQVFHGVGSLMEGWFAPVGPDQAERVGLEAVPHRFENRSVFYAARDGFMWEVIRFRRRADGVTLPRHCRVYDPDDPLGGTITEALSRICNALAGNPVPIRPR
jgi:hypothetical protein